MFRDSPCCCCVVVVVVVVVVFDIIIIIAGLVCLVSMAGIAFVLRSRSNAQRVGEFAQGAIGGVFRLVKRTPPNVVESVVGFNDTAAEMVGTRWVPITITNILAQLTPMFVVLAALRGVGADSVTVLEVFAAFSVALLLTTVPLAPGGAGTVDAALIGMLVAFGASFEQAVAARLGPVERHPAGSAFKICAVAEGRADAYPRFGPTSEWDTAAAQVVLEEAGGHLLDARGRRFRYNRRDTLLNAGFLAVGAEPVQWLACWPS